MLVYNNLIALICQLFFKNLIKWKRFCLRIETFIVVLYN